MPCYTLTWHKMLSIAKHVNKHADLTILRIMMSNFLGEKKSDRVPAIIRSPSIMIKIRMDDKPNAPCVCVHVFNPLNQIPNSFPKI